MSSDFEKKFYLRKEVEKEICDYLKDHYFQIDFIEEICEDIISNVYKRILQPPPETVKINYLHNVPTIPCGNYGCSNLRRVSQIWCDACQIEYIEDPDAFK